MTLDHDTPDQLRQGHPAWRLLRADHAALVASFLNRVFIVSDRRVLERSDLAEALEDDLYALSERLGVDAFPGSALDYLNDWASPEKGWLRKFYRQDSDEPQFQGVSLHGGHTPLLSRSCVPFRNGLVCEPFIRLRLAPPHPRRSTLLVHPRSQRPVHHSDCREDAPELGDGEDQSGGFAHGGSPATEPVRRANQDG